ncbi:unnamed protein product, partial [Thlaspi arvense]
KRLFSRFNYFYISDEKFVSLKSKKLVLDVFQNRERRRRRRRAIDQRTSLTATPLSPAAVSCLHRQLRNFASSFKNRDVSTLLPLTLKQLNSVSTNGESNFSIDGVDINTVAIVGRVARMENIITQVDFVVDDGTGCIEYNCWCYERQETEVEAVRLGMYVRLHGHLKNFQGKRSVNVFSVRPVTDFNEIVHHFTECISVHMYNTKWLCYSGYCYCYSTTPTPANPYQTGPSNQLPNQFNDPMHGVKQEVMNYLNQPMHLDALEQLANGACVLDYGRDLLQINRKYMIKIDLSLTFQSSSIVIKHFCIGPKVRH